MCSYVNHADANNKESEKSPEREKKETRRTVHQSKPDAEGAAVSCLFNIPTTHNVYLSDGCIMKILPAATLQIKRAISSSHITRIPGAGIMEADDHHVKTVFAVQLSFQQWHLTN